MQVGNDFGMQLIRGMGPVTTVAVLTLVGLAALIDVRARRIPNLLVLPYLIAGISFQTALSGFAGLKHSVAGIAVALVGLGGFCALRAVGMGDLKLCAAVGAWIGGTRLEVALIVTAVAGALIALLPVYRRGSLGETLDGAAELASGFPTRGLRSHPVLRLDNPRASAMPYAPAIALGTIFSLLIS